MRRIKRVVLFAALVGAGSSFVGSASGALPGVRDGCPLPKAHVMLRDREALVYEAPVPAGATGLGESELPLIFGCARGHERSFGIGDQPGASSEGGGGVEKETLAGPLVAYEAWEKQEGVGGPPTTSRSLLVVADLRTGRVVHKLPTGSSEPPFKIGAGHAAALVLKRDGAIAWITGGGGPVQTVHALDRLGNRVLGVGPGISRRSLRLNANIVSWTKHGRRYSVRLD